MSASESEIQARLLAQALPYMQRYENKTIVVKYGGHAMGNADLGRAFASDIALLKQSGVNPIVVHGGGPQIGAMLNRMGIESKFEGGLRVTDEKTVEIVEMVLAGSINKEIVALINQTGEWAIGLCGKDGNMVFAEKAKKTFRDPDSNIERVLDSASLAMSSKSTAPFFICSPVRDDTGDRACGAGTDGHTYNINADTFAGAIAGGPQCDAPSLLTDVPAFSTRRANSSSSSRRRGRALIADGTSRAA
ncbi:acetylglutamate kinase [Sinorhizobium meliloti]|nr:acetylglutamate kinase [Sinorhizobium meliloti]